MSDPNDPRLRVIPIVDPIPVFAWSIMWRRSIPETAIEQLLAGARADETAMGEHLIQDPRRVWLPDADRAWWLRSMGDEVARTDAAFARRHTAATC